MSTEQHVGATFRPARIVPALSTETFRDGVRDVVPLTFGIAVWGVVTGVAMVRGGIPLWWSIVIGLVAYAGSAQLAVVPLIVSRAPIPIVLFTATLVNLRFLIFSAAMREEFAHLHVVQRYVAAYVNGDFTFTLFRARFGSRPEGEPPAPHPHHMGYFWGVAALNFVVWNASSTLGMVLGNGLPDSWGLDVASTLALVSVTIPLLAVSFPAGSVVSLADKVAAFLRRPITAGVFTTAVTSVLTARFPYRLGLVGSMLLGIAVAVVFDIKVGARLPENEAGA